MLDFLHKFNQAFDRASAGFGQYHCRNYTHHISISRHTTVEHIVSHWYQRYAPLWRFDAGTSVDQLFRGLQQVLSSTCSDTIPSRYLLTDRHASGEHNMSNWCQMCAIRWGTLLTNSLLFSGSCSFYWGFFAGRAIQ